MWASAPPNTRSTPRSSEHRRAVRLAADARERERIARSRAVKEAAAATDGALAQPVERPMRGVRLGETWIEVDRLRHPLTAAVTAQMGDAELRVSGEGWTARLVLAPGEGPARAASEAAVRIRAAARGAVDAAHRRLHAASELGPEHAAVCHAAAAALAAADHEVAVRHADRARIDALPGRARVPAGAALAGRARRGVGRARPARAGAGLHGGGVRAAVRLDRHLAQARRGPDDARPARARGGRGADARAAG